MIKRINKLTKKQTEAMEAYRNKWIEQGLKTGETDWETFSKYMPICYQKAKLSYPKNIVRVQSPLVGGLASAIAEAILKKHKKGGAVRGTVRGTVRGAVGDAVRDAVGGAVGDAVDDAVRGAVGDAVGDAVRGAVGDAVRDAVDDAVGGAVDDAVGIIKKIGLSIYWHDWFGGQFWVGGWYWGIAFVNFFFDICKLKLSKDIMERAQAYRKVCESVNYIWPNRDFVMVCARPTKINRDERGRLHSISEKSIEYPDGWGLYHIHGVKFSEEQFKKTQNASVEEILGWEDIDQRSVLLRERSIEQLLEKIPKTLIDRTDECGGYELYELELKDIGKAKILSYKSWSSDKMYVKFVPTDSAKCLETVAKLRHQNVKELKQSFEHKLCS